jgi:hypothetical protein
VHKARTNEKGSTEKITYRFIFHHGLGMLSFTGAVCYNFFIFLLNTETLT